MDIRIPTVGESVVEALLAKWHKPDGAFVQKDEAVCEIETDKITMDIFAETSGQLSVLAPAGTTLAVGSVIGQLNPAAEQPPVPTQSTSASGQPEAATSPTVRQAMREIGVTSGQVLGSGPAGRILLADVPERSSAVDSTGKPATATAPVVVKSEEPPAYQASVPSQPAVSMPGEERVRMTPLRKRIAERLLQARQQTAMLTTFNEVDLAALQAYRQQRKQIGLGVGLLPFFVQAAVEALRLFPAVNARIDGEDIVYHHFYHLGVAVSTDKGLVVPVLRNAEQLGLQEIDAAIAGFVAKIKANQLAIADLEGGTFTISNGGTYGSMLSTPIINPPQSGVLGMHAIQERPVVRDGQIVIRPVMYLALSYDHRIIDGREAVGFVKAIKERLEDSSWLAGLK